MEIPQTFVQGKNSEANLERMIKQDYDLNTVRRLLNSCEEYLKKQKGAILDLSYTIGERLAERIDYTKEDLKFLSQKLEVENLEDMYLGFYLSALVNKIIPEGDGITLKLNEKLRGIGAHLRGITLTILGDVGSDAGLCMNGGRLIIKGSAEAFTAAWMKKGIIIVKGNIGKSTGFFMEEGILRAYGEIGSIDSGCKGKIYKKNRLVWPKE